MCTPALRVPALRSMHACMLREGVHHCTASHNRAHYTHKAGESAWCLAFELRRVQFSVVERLRPASVDRYETLHIGEHLGKSGSMHGQGREHTNAQLLSRGASLKLRRGRCEGGNIDVGTNDVANNGRTCSHGQPKTQSTEPKHLTPGSDSTWPHPFLLERRAIVSSLF
jgi:hypothetical protein